MIVQSAPAGEPRFVIRMTEHTAFAGALARAFGNDEFEPVSPREEMLFVIDHHDQGWSVYDDDPGRDPKTGLPYHLTETPREVTLATGIGSPDFNETHHPFCGLIASMHIWGLYNGRYGLSDRMLLDLVPADYRARFDAMLDGQLERQARLKAELAKDKTTAVWIEDGPLFQNYKQLQLFDTLALYFQCAHEGTREPAEFLHVPKSATDDVTVRVEPVTPGTYRFAPFPFAEDGIELAFEGRFLAPIQDETAAMGDAMRSAAVETQSVRFVS